MNATDIRFAIADADARTARAVEHGDCACCTPAVPIARITSALTPRGAWLDADGCPHAPRTRDRRTGWTGR